MEEDYNWYDWHEKIDRSCDMNVVLYHTQCGFQLPNSIKFIGSYSSPHIDQWVDSTLKTSKHNKEAAATVLQTQDHW